MENKSKTEAQEIIERLKHLPIVAGSPICYGCLNTPSRNECSLHGCFIIREVAALIGKQERKINRQTNELCALKGAYSRDRQEMVNALYAYSHHNCDCCDAMECGTCKHDVPPQFQKDSDPDNWRYNGVKPEKGVCLDDE